MFRVGETRFRAGIALQGQKIAVIRRKQYEYWDDEKFQMNIRPSERLELERFFRAYTDKDDTFNLIQVSGQKRRQRTGVEPAMCAVGQRA